MIMPSSRSPSKLGWSSPSPCTPNRASPTRFGWSAESPVSGLNDSSFFAPRNAYASFVDSRASTPAQGSRPASRGTGFGSLPQTPTSKDRAISPAQGQDSRPGSAPLSHAQRVAELHYDQFNTRRLQNCARSHSSSSDPTPSRRRKKTRDVSCAWAQIPSSWRPGAFEVEVEMKQTGLEFNEALASLVVGRDTATTLATLAKADRPSSQQAKQSSRASSMPIASQRGYSSPVQDLNDSSGLSPCKGVLDVKACLDLSSHGSSAMDGPPPSRVVAAAALLQGSEGNSDVCTVQMESMDIDEAPETLHILSKLSALSLSANVNLHNIAALRKCSDIRALDLSGCSQLCDIQVLGVLPFLEVVDLSGCVRVEDITPLLVPAQRNVPVGAVNVDLLPNLSSATSPVKGVRKLRAQKREQSYDRVQCQSRNKQLGHPSLRWLSLAGCASLKRGILHLSNCEAIVYVDLYRCLNLEASDCFLASQIVGLRGDFVWPSRSMLAESMLAQNLSQAQRNQVTAAAANAIAEKLAVSRGMRPIPSGTSGLPNLTGQAKRDAMNSAISAASDMGIFTKADQAKWDAGETLAGCADTEKGTSGSHQEAGEAYSTGDNRQRLGCAPPRIGPVDFARAARVVGFEDPNDVDVCDVFRILDEDRDGGLTEEELCALEYGPPVAAESDAAIQVLLRRRGGSVEAVAADLAGNRKTVDKSRLQECFIVAGVNETSARRIAHSLAYCCSAELCSGDEDAEETILHALNGYGVAHSIVLLKDFRDHLRSRFPRCEDAYWVLSENRQANVSWDEFHRRVLDPIRWPFANTPRAVERLFQALDIGGLGIITVDAFQLLEDFQPQNTLRALVHAGRSICRGLAGGAPAAFRLDESLDEKSFLRSEFVTTWDELGEACQEVDGRLIFGLLDVQGNDLLTGRELFSLSEALVRRAEAAALGSLEGLFTERFGSLQQMHQMLLQKDAFAALPVHTERAPSKTKVSIGGPKNSIASRSTLNGASAS